jgi:hypothetical protein
VPFAQTLAPVCCAPNFGYEHAMATEKQKEAARHNLEKARSAQSARAKAKGGKDPKESSGIGSAQREKLDDDEFAFPDERKEPLIDAGHVRNAVARFNQVEGVSDDERDKAWERIRSAPQARRRPLRKQLARSGLTSGPPDVGSRQSRRGSGFPLDTDVFAGDDGAMSGQLPRKPLPGSNRVAPLSDRMGDPRPGTPATVTVYLRGDEPVPGRLSREEYAAAHGAAAEDIEAVRRFATEHGLRIGDVDRGRRSVEVSGDLGSIAGAFGATLGIYQAPGGDPYRARVGGLSLPPELDGIVTGVFGLDERPQAQPHFRPLATASTTYTPPQVAAAYDYPTAFSGSGECVALIELGGGFREDDLSDYFSSLGIALPASRP